MGCVIMADTISAGVALPSTVAPTPVTATPASHHHGFREFLSELNPLQYIPVVGTLYRAITGDRIPELAREAGSLVVSGLTGGPIGIAINLGTVAAEKITGIDPEKIGSEILASLGIGEKQPVSDVKPPAGTLAGTPAVAPEIATAASPAWSPAQLTAYGVTQTADGTLSRGTLHGADVLNDLVLAEHRGSLA